MSEPTFSNEATQTDEFDLTLKAALQNPAPNRAVFEAAFAQLRQTENNPTPLKLNPAKSGSFWASRVAALLVVALCGVFLVLLPALSPTNQAPNSNPTDAWHYPNAATLKFSFGTADEKTAGKLLQSTPDRPAQIETYYRKAWQAAGYKSEVTKCTDCETGQKLVARQAGQQLTLEIYAADRWQAALKLASPLPAGQYLIYLTVSAN